MSAERASARVLLALLVLGLAVRLAFAFGARGVADWPDDDNRAYHAAAAGLLHGQPLPMRWPPLLPLLAAGVMAVAGESIVATKLVTLLAGALVVPLTALLGARWGGPRAGLVAGLLAAFEGYLVVHSASAMADMLLCALLTAALVALPDAEDPRPLGRLVLAGLLLGLAGLARPTGLPLAAALAAGQALVLLLRGRIAAAVGRAALLAGVAVLVVLPWGAWNLARSGHLVMTTTGGGSTLLGGNCAPVLAEGEGWLPADRCGVFSPAELERLAAMPEPESDRLLWATAVADLRAHPERWRPLLAHKMAGFWGWGAEGLRGSLLKRLSLLTLTLLLPFAAAGAVLVARHARAARRGATPLAESLLAVAATLALSLVFWGGSRMRVPVEPVLLALAAVAFLAAARRAAAVVRTG